MRSTTIMTVALAFDSADADAWTIRYRLADVEKWIEVPGDGAP